MANLTHLGTDGKADMVDVGGQAETERTAIAEGAVTMQAETLLTILAGEAKKGKKEDKSEHKPKAEAGEKKSKKK